MEKENLQFFTLKNALEELINNSGLPLYARMMALKMVAEASEKLYLESVQKEYQDFQNEQQKKIAEEQKPRPMPTEEKVEPSGE
jgi:hypothetical protein